jgi:F0F1-type ATP synthase gamma subunit
MRQRLAFGIPLDSGEAPATSLEGLHDLVKQLANLLGKRHASGELGTLRVIHGRYQSIGEQVPVEIQVLPPDLSWLRSSNSAQLPPFHRYLRLSELLAGLVDEYAFISLCCIAAESFTSEQASWSVAMDSST